jgi:hypothetical protein
MGEGGAESGGVSGGDGFMKSVTKPCDVTYDECHETVLCHETFSQLFLLQQTLILRALVIEPPLLRERALRGSGDMRWVR